MEKFEDINIEGIGNLKNFQDKIVEEIRATLSKDRFAFFVATEPIPAGWPDRIMKIKKGEIERNNRKMTVDLNEWYLTMDGITWKEFYCYVLTVYIDEIKLIPGFIYERKTFQEKMIYIPIVSVLLSLDGKIQSASKSWCDAVLRNRFEKNNLTKEGGDGML